MNEELKELKERARRAMGLYRPSACDLIGRLLLALEAAEQQVAELNKGWAEHLNICKEYERRMAELSHELENAYAGGSQVMRNEEAAQAEVKALRDENKRLLSESAEFVAEAQSQIISLTARVAEMEAERDALKEKYEDLTVGKPRGAGGWYSVAYHEKALLQAQQDTARDIIQYIVDQGTTRHIEVFYITVEDLDELKKKYNLPLPASKD